MRRHFARDLDSLSAMYEFTEETLAANNIDGSVRFPVHLAMEELFTNMVKYNPEANSDITVDIDVEDGTVRVTFTEFDVDEFDVSQPRQLDTGASLDDRKPGGLGLYLLQNVVDDLEYNYRDRRSTVVFTKGSG